MRLPLPADMSGFIARSTAHFLTFCGVDESLGVHSLHLVVRISALKSYCMMLCMILCATLCMT